VILYHDAIISNTNSADIKPDKHTELQTIKYDEKRFILSYRLIIKKASLQIYNSTLVFSPTKNIIRKIFLD